MIDEICVCEIGAAFVIIPRFLHPSFPFLPIYFFVLGLVQPLRNLSPSAPQWPKTSGRRRRANEEITHAAWGRRTHTTTSTLKAQRKRHAGAPFLWTHERFMKLQPVEGYEEEEEGR